MCGIVGYFGAKDAKDVVISGLEKLEYRGYDSAGIAMVDKTNNLIIFKEKGRVANLKATIDYSIESNKAIGHTRWATHGEPNKINAHPHHSENNRFTIVHNGIIENYITLKNELLTNYKFYSQTDTEVIANLIEYFSTRIKGTGNAIRKALSMCEGSYAVLVIDKEKPNKLYFATNKSVLLIGIDDNGYTLASDLVALVGNAKSYIRLQDKSFGVIDNDKLCIYDITGFPMEYKKKSFDIKLDDLSKGGFPHYMLKEIYEQPYVLHRILNNYYKKNKININRRLIRDLKNAKKINLVACGTSMHASYVAKYYLENMCGIPAEVYCASEAVYSDILIKNNQFFIYMSQSGETADSIAVMKKYSNYKSLVITNNIESTMSRLATYSLDVYAGPEIAVASTKAYTAQIAISYILAKAIMANNNLSELTTAINSINSLLQDKNKYIEIAKQISKQKDLFYIGRGLDYYTALEASLKLKEISYIHSEAIPSGEFKHGPIAMIKDNVPVITIISDDSINLPSRANLAETKARLANTIIISTDNISNDNDDIIVPYSNKYLAPLTSIVACQLIAYYVALELGNDIDKPLNLAKSVTVE